MSLYFIKKKKVLEKKFDRDDLISKAYSAAYWLVKESLNSKVLIFA